MLVECDCRVFLSAENINPTQSDVIFKIEQGCTEYSTVTGTCNNMALPTPKFKTPDTGA